jgi:hypothetical protein
MALHSIVASGRAGSKPAPQRKAEKQKSRKAEKQKAEKQKSRSLTHSRRRE